MTKLLKMKNISNLSHEKNKAASSNDHFIHYKKGAEN